MLIMRMRTIYSACILYILHATSELVSAEEKVKQSIYKPLCNAFCGSSGSLHYFASVCESFENGVSKNVYGGAAVVVEGEGNRRLLL